MKWKFVGGKLWNEDEEAYVFFWDDIPEMIQSYPNWYPQGHFGYYWAQYVILVIVIARLVAALLVLFGIGI